MVLLDGSEPSKRGLIETLKIVDKDKDVVECLTVEMDSKSKDNGEICRKAFENAGYTRGKFTLLPADGQAIPAAISGYLAKESTPDYDFVVLGSRGATSYSRPDSHKLGSVAEKVLVVAKTNMLLVVK